MALPPFYVIRSSNRIISRRFFYDFSVTTRNFSDPPQVTKKVAVFRPHVILETHHNHT